jgi:fructose-1,6-bisphosphatase/sedoheptulose 1,7-bisphosphatase-like protein
MPKGMPNKAKTVAKKIRVKKVAAVKKAPAAKLSLQNVADTHAKILVVVRKAEEKALAAFEKAKAGVAKAAVTKKLSAKAKATPAAKEAAAKKRAASKIAAAALKIAKGELKSAKVAVRKALASERKVISAQAKLAKAKAVHELKVLGALAKLETRLAKAALKGAVRRRRVAKTA